MAPAIGHAARRIGGGAIIQRTAAEPTRLVSTRVLTADEKKDAAIRMVLIDRKTEELYDLVAGLRANYIVNGSVGQKYSSLLDQLSVQIKPRHDDPSWRSCRRSARIDDCAASAGAFLIGCVAAEGLLRWYRWRNP